MKTIIVAGSIALLIGTVAMGQSVPSEIAYILEVGGDNHVADWENAGAVVTTAFTPGQAADGYTLDQATSSVLTWDVVVTSQGYDELQGLWFQGAANLTFNVELYDAAGAAVTGNRFFSTMNDGDRTGYRRSNQGVNDPFEKAAFCLGWDVDLDHNGVLDGVFGGLNVGRLFDPPTAAGPGMDRAQFPSNAYHGGGRLKGSDTNYWRDCNGNNPTAVTADSNGDGRKDDLDEIFDNPALDANTNGIIDACEAGAVTLTGTALEPLAENKLSGMGCGYSEYKLWNGTVGNDLGVGLALGSVTPVWTDGDDVIGLNATPTIPVAEGQINMDGLPVGTYRLVVTVPANANNVIPVLYTPTTAGAGGFAVKADQVVTDEIIFQWNPNPVTPVQPVAWKSLKTHLNAVGEQAVDLVMTDTAATSEPRGALAAAAGFTKLSIQFDGNLSTAGFVNDAAHYVLITQGAGLTVTSQALATTVLTNDTLIVNLTGSVDRTCYKFDVSNVCTLKGTADKTCSGIALAGDANNDKRTNFVDASFVRSANGQPVLPSNIRKDYNIDGRINFVDASGIRSKNNNTAVVCP